MDSFFSYADLFFLSGMCLNIKRPAKEYIYKKFKRMFPWQIFLAIICITYDWIANGSVNFVQNVFIWFLPVLFYSEVVFWALNKMFTNYIYVYIICITSIFLVHCLNIRTVLHFECVPMALLFVTIGYCMKKYLLEYRKIHYAKLKIFCLLLITILIARKNSSVLMYNNDYGNLAFFMITAICGILIICAEGKKWQNNTILQAFGKNSVLVYVLHFRLTNLLHFLLNKGLKIKLDLYKFPRYWVIFLLEMLFMYMSIVIFVKIKKIIVNKKIQERVY